jgi:hypothetical protein
VTDDTARDPASTPGYAPPTQHASASSILATPAAPTPPHDGPHRRRQGRSLGGLALEVAMVGVGVFLALMGEQWRERSEHRELARASLGRFRAEFVANRAAVVAVKDRHARDLEEIKRYFGADSAARAGMPRPFHGTHPAFLEYTAWDLALATQALSYVDPQLASAIAHDYAIQRQLDAATRDITQTMYMKSGDADPRPFLASIAIYFGDCTLIEPRLVAQYDSVLLRLDRALGGVAVGAALSRR